MRVKPITKEMIINAFQFVKSHRAASRYLNCSYQHYRKYAKLYVDENGINLFEKYKNQSGRGIKKKWKIEESDVSELINGNLDWNKYPIELIKYKLINEGYLKEECYQCGFNHRRPLDYKMPLLINFIDRNKNNVNINNLELLCYNCFFITIGDIFSKNQKNQLESHLPVKKEEEPIQWELDDYHFSKLKELGIYNDEKEENTGEQYIAK